MMKCQCDCDCKTKSYEYCEHCHYPLTRFVPDDQPKGTLKDFLTPNPSEWRDDLRGLMTGMRLTKQHKLEIDAFISNLLASSQMRAEEKVAKFREAINSDELIDRQEHWLTKSLETVEFDMAMDALRGYQRDLSDLLEKK